MMDLISLDLSGDYQSIAIQMHDAMQKSVDDRKMITDRFLASRYIVENDYFCAHKLLPSPGTPGFLSWWSWQVHLPAHDVSFVYHHFFL